MTKLTGPEKAGTKYHNLATSFLFQSKIDNTTYRISKVIRVTVHINVLIGVQTVRYGWITTGTMFLEFIFI